MTKNLISNLLSKSVCLLLSAVSLTFVSANFGHAQTAEEVLKIRGEVAAINKEAAKYTRTTKTVEDIALEGTEAVYFHSAGNLKKIAAQMFGETYNAAGEFYYADGELIFAFLKRRQYDAPIGTNAPPKVIRAEEQRYYFAGGKLIRLLAGKKEIKSGDEKYTQLKEEITEISDRLKNP